LLVAGIITALILRNQTPSSNTGIIVDGEDVRGNTVGNFMQAGLVAQEGEWIYYVIQNNSGNIYRIRTDGTGKQKLTDAKCANLNIWNGWIYYCNSTERCVSKIKINGKGKKNLPNTEAYSNISIVNGCIYYINLFYGYELYKMDLDGSNKQQISDEAVYAYCVSDGWIYYTPAAYITKANKETDEDNCMYKMKLDGSQKEKISDDFTVYLYVMNDWIYYNNFEDDYKMYKIKTDGSERTKICDEKILGPMIMEDWIYYAVENASDSGLYKMRLDGTERTKIFNEMGLYGLNYAGGWFYYLTKNGERMKFDDPFYRIRIDGTEKQLVD